MRRPRRVRNIALVIALLGAAAVGAALLTHRAAAGHWSVPILGVGGLKVFLISLAVAASAAFYARRYDRLRAGVDRIAAWTIEPNQWHAFIELNERLNAVPGNVPCRIDAHLQRGVHTVEFMAGRESLLFCEVFHWLPARGSDKIRAAGWLPGPPGCIELIITSHGKNVITYSLRVPVPPRAEADAQRVLDHYHARIAPPPRMNLPRRRKIALIFAGVWAVSAGVFAAMLPGDTNTARAVALTGTFASGLFCLTSLFIAWVFHNWIKRPVRSSEPGE